MSSSEGPAIVTRPRSPAGGLSAVPEPAGPGDSGSPWLRVDIEDAVAVSAALHPGYGRTAFLRRRPVRIVDGRIEGGYTRVFELICPSCGDNPYLDVLEVSPRLQWLRGPYTLADGLVAYEEHLDDHWS